MKKVIVAGLAAGFLFTTIFAAAASADWYNGCKKKEQILETKIENAKKYGNRNQLKGLEEALRQVRSNCTDGSKNYQYKADSKIKDKRKEVEERQRELNDAIREGAKPDKIKKRQRKLEEAKTELAEATRERNAWK